MSDLIRVLGAVGGQMARDLLYGPRNPRWDLIRRILWVIALAVIAYAIWGDIHGWGDVQ